MVRFLSLLLVGVAVASCSRATGTGPATLPYGAIGASATRSSQASELATYTQIHSFSPPPDGNSPSSDVIHNSDNGRFYGTTYGGGATPPSGPCAQGCGTVYSIDPSGSKPEKVVYAFKGDMNGAIPQGGLTNPVNGVIYGTTSNGGHKDAANCPQGCGTVFKIDSSDGESVAYRFKGGTQDGSNPVGGVRNANGVLFGTTEYGGTGGYGTVFELTASGERVLYSFSGRPEGAYPVGNLSFLNGVLYGVTRAGGTYNVGTIFKLLPTSGAVTKIHNFKSAEGDSPVGLESVPPLNMLYGAASTAGAFERGTVFAMTPDGSIKWIYSFKNVKGDGSSPLARPIFYKNALYGTTDGGGVGGNGTIYKIGNVASGKDECVLHSFGKLPQGVRPDAPLRQWNNLLYGTTVLGGSGYHDEGLGTVFKISPASCPSTSRSARFNR